MKQELSDSIIEAGLTPANGRCKSKDFKGHHRGYKRLP